MKKGKKAYVAFGILTAIFTIAAIVLAVMLNAFYVPVQPEFVKPFLGFARFAQWYQKTMLGTPGWRFPEVKFIISPAVGFVMVFLGLSWMFTALCKRKFIGLLYGLLMCVAGFIGAFGTFLTLNVVMSGDTPFNFVFNYLDLAEGLPLAIATVACCLGASVLWLVFFFIGASRPSKKKEKAALDAEPKEEPKKEKPAKKAKAKKVEEKKEEPAEEPVKEEVKEEPQPEPVQEEPKEEIKPEPVKEQPAKVEPKKEEPKPEAKPAPVKKEAPKKEPAKKAEPKEEPKKEAPVAPKQENKEDSAEKKPAVKKGPVKPQKEEEKKPEPKKSSKKEEPKVEEKQEMAKEKEPAKKAEKKGDGKVYHVSKDPEKNMWVVKLAQTGGAAGKVINSFATKPEAEAYVNQLCENTGRKALFHASKGKNKGRIQ